MNKCYSRKTVALAGLVLDQVARPCNDPELWQPDFRIILYKVSAVIFCKKARGTNQSFVFIAAGKNLPIEHIDL